MAERINFNVGDIVEIIGNTNNHQFRIGEHVRIVRQTDNNQYQAQYLDESDYWYVKYTDIKLINNNINNKMTKQQLMKDAVKMVADILLTANNTVTTLEIKVELRKTDPEFYWDQATVSKYMDELSQAGDYTFADNGTYRVYSSTKIPAPKPTTGVKIRKQRVSTPSTTLRITRKKALDLMKANKGHFFTAVFTKKDGTLRSINCQYLKDQTNSDLGYVKVKEAIKMKLDPNDCTRQINLQTLTSLKIAGQTYKVK